MRCEFLKPVWFKEKIGSVTAQCLVTLTLQQLSSNVDGGIISFKKKKALLRYDVLTIKSVHLFKVYKSVIFNKFIELCIITIIQF